MKETTMSVLKKEPALVTAFVVAAIGVASSFGLGITDGQRAAVVALVGAALALVGGVAVRQQVTPAAKADEAVQVAAVLPHPASLDPETDAPLRDTDGATAIDAVADSSAEGK